VIGKPPTARTPIIVLTAAALEEDARRALAADPDAHVSKPITWLMLLEAVRRFISPSDDSDLTSRDGAH